MKQFALGRPSKGGAPNQFLDLIPTLTKAFIDNKVSEKIDERSVTMNDYQKLLCILFHQVQSSSATFALAGANCPSNRMEIRDYLIKHAEEERTHWTWILNDLSSTGYQGPDPSKHFPNETTQAYIAFNFYVAHKQPVARLGIAAMLETLGGTFSKKYMEKAASIIKITPNQASFFFGHGDTDVGHSKEIFDLLNASDLTSTEWDWICHSAEVACALYKKMFDLAVT